MKTKHLSHSIVALVLTLIFAGVCAAQTVRGEEIPKDDSNKYYYCPLNFIEQHKN